MLKYLKNLEINNMSIIKSTILLETQKYWKKNEKIIISWK